MAVEYQERRRRIRARYPKAYERWSEGDDNLLKQEYKVGVGIEELSQLLQRQPSAIKSRLRKLGLSTGKKGQKKADASICVGFSLGNKGQKKADASICVGFSFEWQAVLQDSGREYSFPGQITNFMKRLYRCPAIYCWNLWGNDQAHPQPIYIGSTKQLCPDRLKRHLNPRASKTNIRLNE